MIYLLDASIYVFRGWFALPDSITTPGGEPANGFRGFATTLADTLEIINGQPLLICFDESLTRSFRNEIDPAYKANRELPPPELEAQFRWCRELGEALGLPCLASDRFEADDLMASVATLARRDQHAVTVISRDKDLAQILQAGDQYWEGPGKPPMDYPAMEAKLGFPPERMADYLALVGDAVDNIPGVKGIGKQTATRLLAAFDNLEQLFDGLEQLPELGIRGSTRIVQLLEAGREVAFSSRRLTRVVHDAPLPFSSIPPGQRTPHKAALESLNHSIGLGERNYRKLLALSD